MVLSVWPCLWLWPAVHELISLRALNSLRISHHTDTVVLLDGLRCCVALREAVWCWLVLFPDAQCCCLARSGAVRCRLVLGCCLIPSVLTGAEGCLQPIDLNQRDHSGFTLLNLVTSFGHFAQQKKVPIDCG